MSIQSLMVYTGEVVVNNDADLTAIIEDTGSYFDDFTEGEVETIFSDLSEEVEDEETYLVYSYFFEGHPIGSLYIHKSTPPTIKPTPWKPYTVCYHITLGNARDLEKDPETLKSLENFL